MWGIVENLGLKDGLVEFKEQFSRDAKSTIADTSFAKNRGIDVAKLEEWEQTVQQQKDELHDRTIGRAVDLIVGDDISANGGVEGADALRDDPSPQDSRINALVAVASASEGHEPSESAAVVAVGSASTTAGDSPSAGSEALTPTSATSAASSPSASTGAVAVAAAAVTAAASQVSAAKAAAATARSSRAKAAERAEQTRKLEAKSRELSTTCDEAEKQLSAARSQCSQLEDRWLEISAVSDDALRQAEEMRQEVMVLRRALDEKVAQISEAEDCRERLTVEKCAAERRRDELEASFQKCLEREISQKEQELIEEVEYLKKTTDIKNRRLQELADEKAQLERRALEKSSSSSSSGKGPSQQCMMEAHVAIAMAFGDAGSDHPCLRLMDEPSLKFTAALFKQPLFRRAFFFSSGILWLFAFQQAVLAPTTGHHIHV